MNVGSKSEEAQDALLLAIASASSVLLDEPELDRSIPKALASIGLAVGLSHVFAFECQTDHVTGALLATQRFSWGRPGTAPQPIRTGRTPLNLTHDAPEWVERLRQGQMIEVSTRTCAACERELLALRGIASARIFPFLRAGQLLGLIFFCTQDEAEVWSDSACAFSRAAASAIGAAFVRNRIQAEHERLLAAIEQANESIVITDPDGTINYVNPAFVQTSGYACMEVIGKNVRILKSEVHDTRFYKEIWATISAGKTWRGRFVNRRKDGALYTEDASLSPVRDAKGRIVNYVAVKRDISDHLRETEEKAKLEAQLAQAQKLDSIGRLAGGVAHDFNNMLQTIMGYTELALDNCAPTDALHDDLQEIYKAARRSADLTRQLLAFARQQTITPKVIDINASITGMLKMLRRLLGEDLNLQWIPGVANAYVKMDPSQLDQILANLTVNARDALSGAGTLTIATRKLSLTKAPECPTDIAPGTYIVMTVSDTGCGMNKETIDHIFEPFFTTKPRGVGGGLGLATVYGIIKQNAGYITVDSKPGQGTTFHVYLPSAEADAETVRAPVSDAPCAGGSETILVVEDEQAISVTICRFLRSLGYHVLVATTPEEALNLDDAYAGAIDLLITDVIMPGMNGRDLACLLTAKRPSMTCLFISGYTEDIIAHRGIVDAGFFFLPKPFSKADLARKIREVLVR